MTLQDFLTLLPHTVLLVWASILLLIDLWIPKDRKGITAAISCLGFATTGWFTISQVGQLNLAYQGMVVVDPFSGYLNILFCGAGIATIMLSYEYLKRMGINRGEFYPLVMFSVAGMMLMASADDLIMVFLALELLSIPLYILSGFAVPRPESEEAALKYFLLGAFASGFILYGTALTFGATGQTAIPEIMKAASAGVENQFLLVIGAGLLLVGFGFKIAVVPFHMWTPDVYQGAPSPVTGFMSVGAKAAGFAALVRVLSLAFPPIAEEIAPVIGILSALTMIVGNFAALTQTNIKRMLDYSSIAHAGYILLAFVPFSQTDLSTNTVSAVLFYLLVYGITSMGTWAVVTALEKPEGKGLDINDYSGLGKSKPILALVMAVFMLSFTGVPPLLGFWGKFTLFKTAIEGGYALLAVIGLITSLVSAWYYLRVIVVMYMHSGEPSASRDVWVNLLAILSATAVILLGLVPGSVLQWAVGAVLGQF
jgi:NADH-quinone oxidoreductase subunit N